MALAQIIKKPTLFSAEFWIAVVDLKHIFSLSGFIYNIIHLYSVEAAGFYKHGLNSATTPTLPFLPAPHSCLTLCVTLQADAGGPYGLPCSDSSSLHLVPVVSRPVNIPVE